MWLVLLDGRGIALVVFGLDGLVVLAGGREMGLREVMVGRSVRRVGGVGV